MKTFHLILGAAGMAARIVLLLSFVLGSTHIAASPPTDWRLLLPSRVVPSIPFHAGAFDVAHGNAIFVGVEQGSAIATSPDGLNWKPALTNITPKTVAFGEGVFVAIGVCGDHYTSPNGVHWERQGAVNCEMNWIRYLNDLFVVIGQEYLGDGKWAAVLYTSTDGRQFIRRLRVLPARTQNGVYFEGVAYGNGRFLVTGTNYGPMGSNGIIYISTDAVQWAPADPDPPLSFPTEIAFAGSGFILFDSNRILTSADGVSWQLRHQLDGSNGTWIARGMRGMASVGNRVVCLVEQNPGSGSPRVALASDDGISWHETPMPGVVDWHLFSDSTTFFALAERSALSSPDGIAWTEHFTPYPLDADTPGLQDVAYGSERFVAVGLKGTIITSSDGASWENRGSGTGQSLTDVIHAGARYVAAGSGGALLHSSDGQTWTPANLGGVTLRLGPLAYGGDRFVLLTRSAGNGFYWTSDDGIDWQVRFSQDLSTFAGFSSMAFGNGRFLATGAEGAVAVSENGSAWQLVLLPPPYEGHVINQVIFDGERFLGRTSHVGLLASADGRNWSTINAGRFSAIGHGDGNLVAVQQEGSHGPSMIGASPDGAAWTTVAPFRFYQDQNNQRSGTFAYGAGRFVGVGRTLFYDTARLVISGVKPPLLGLRHEAAQLMLRIDGAAGSQWTLQRSPTLLDWQTVGPITLGTEPLEIDVTPSTETHGFWRLAAPDQ